MGSLNVIGKYFLSAVILPLSLISLASAEVNTLESGRARLESTEAQSVANPELDRLNQRMSDAKVVFLRLLNGADGGIPETLLKRSDCVAVLPDVLKAAFVVGGEYGKGVLSCRADNNEWSAPAFVEMRAASFGWQIGGKSTDLVIFFVGEKAKQLLTTNKFTLGADIGVTAGPVGRRAEGSLGDNMEGVYSYAQSEGIFAGLALNGAEVLADKSSNKAYYKTETDLTHLVLDAMPLSSLPVRASEFVQSLPQ